MKPVYRVCTAILGVAVLPVLFFAPLLRLKIKLPLSLDLGIKEYSSIYDFIKAAAGRTEEQKQLMKSLLDALMDKNGTLGSIFTNRPWLYAALVFFVLTVIAAVALCVVSFLSKRTRTPVLVASGGLLSAVLMNVCFNAFAKPLLTGKIGVKSLLGGLGGDNNILSTLLGGAVSIEQLKLSFAYLLTVALFALALLALIGASFDTETKKTGKKGR